MREMSESTLFALLIVGEARPSWSLKIYPWIYGVEKRHTAFGSTRKPVYKNKVREIHTEWVCSVFFFAFSFASFSRLDKHRKSSYVMQGFKVETKMFTWTSAVSCVFLWMEVSESEKASILAPSRSRDSDFFSKNSVKYFVSYSVSLVCWLDSRPCRRNENGKFYFTILINHLAFVWRLFKLKLTDKGRKQVFLRFTIYGQCNEIINQLNARLFQVVVRDSTCNANIFE